MKFYKNDKNEDSSQSALKWGSILGKLLVFAVAVVIVIVLALEVNRFFSGLFKAWDAIRFAYDKPSIVNTVKTDYYKKQQHLDEGFLLSTPSAEEQLLQQVVNQLKQSK